MNDDLPRSVPELPEWAWDIIVKHDLGLRADGPCNAVMVMLTDAGFLVRELADTVFREDAVTPSVIKRLREAIDMLTDAESMASICGDKPKAGVVTVLADGTELWEPASH